MDLRISKYTNEFARSVLDGKSRVYFSKVIIDVHRFWPISFGQFEQQSECIVHECEEIDAIHVLFESRIL